MAKKPNREAPRVVSVERKVRRHDQATPTEMAYWRAASEIAIQRERRTRAEALAYIAAAEQPAPLLRDALHARRLRSFGSPMATDTRHAPQIPAGRPIMIPTADAIISAWVTAGSVALIAIGIALALWWGNT